MVAIFDHLTLCEKNVKNQKAKYVKIEFKVLGYSLNQITISIALSHAGQNSKMPLKICEWERCHGKVSSCCTIGHAWKVAKETQDKIFYYYTILSTSHTWGVIFILSNQHNTCHLKKSFLSVSDFWSLMYFPYNKDHV